MRNLFAILWLMTLGGLAVAGDRVEAPKSLRLFLGGSIWGPTYTVELREGALHYSRRDDGKEESAVIVPTPEQWSAFRRALDVNGVWSWRRTNSNKLDQQRWEVSIAYRGAAKVDCSGYGKSPGRTPTANGGTVEFDNFMRAVRDLLGGRKFE